MNIKRKPLIVEEDLESNPFMEEAPVIKGKQFTKNKKMYVTDDTGNVVDSYVVPSSYTVEEQLYTRIYHHPLYMETILSLSHHATKLYTYITYSINTNKDYVWINKALFKKKASVSQAKYLLAIEELELAGIIYPTEYKEVYFINPYIFFCGNRLKKYPEITSMR